MCLSLAGLSNLVYCLWIKLPHAQLKHLPGASLKGRLLALPTNIRVSWNGLSGTNTLVFYQHSYITDVLYHCQCYKTFFTNLCTNLESLLDRLKKLNRDKHSSLLWKLVTYSRKRFYNIGPWSFSRWRFYWRSFFETFLPFLNVQSLFPVHHLLMEDLLGGQFRSHFRKIVPNRFKLVQML